MVLTRNFLSVLPDKKVNRFIHLLNRFETVAKEKLLEILEARAVRSKNKNTGEAERPESLFTESRQAAIPAGSDEAGTPGFRP
jgi:hypothetical protein